MISINVCLLCWILATMLVVEIYLTSSLCSSFLHQILCLVDLKFLNAGSSSWRLLPLIALIPLIDHQKGYGLEETG
jgi:uncharacterized membrane protein